MHIYCGVYGSLVDSVKWRGNIVWCFLFTSLHKYNCTVKINSCATFIMMLLHKYGDFRWKFYYKAIFYKNWYNYNKAKISKLYFIFIMYKKVYFSYTLPPPCPHSHSCCFKLHWTVLKTLWFLKTDIPTADGDANKINLIWSAAPLHNDSPAPLFLEPLH